MLSEGEALFVRANSFKYRTFLNISLFLPVKHGKVLKKLERKKFEIEKIKINVLKSELIAKKN